MKIRFFLAILFGAAGALSLFAQTTPQIAWVTNAHTDFIYSVAFSADGSRLASGSQDETAKVWSLTNHALLGSFSRNQAVVTSVALSPDGDYLLVGGDDGAARAWQVDSGTLIWGGRRMTRLFGRSRSVRTVQSRWGSQTVILI